MNFFKTESKSASFNSDLEQLEEIQEFIFKEFENLYKNKSRPRSRQGIFLKNEALNTALEEFEATVSKYEQLNRTDIWNDLTDRLEAVKSKYKLCMKILENTKEINPKSKNSEAEFKKVINLRNRRVSFCDNFALENNKVPTTGDLSGHNLTLSEPDLYFGPIRDPNLLSSTLNNHDESELKGEISEIDEFREFSKKFEQIYNSRIENRAKMAEFPTEKAMQCIPEFRGAAAELDAFLFAVDYYAKKIPKNGKHDELVQIVLLKLKGPAAAYFKRIRGDTWEEVKENLEREFKPQFKLEELLQKIETLEQGVKESFQSYKDRALMLKERIDEYEGENEDDPEKESYAERSLRIHFLGGLKNKDLKNLAKTQKKTNHFRNCYTILKMSASM